MNKNICLIAAALLALFFCQAVSGQQNGEIKVRGTGFEYKGEPFEYTGISFFNALYNAEFNRSSASRLEYIKKFNEYGINVIRVWCQWDNARGFIDGGQGQTLYNEDGSIKPEIFSRLTGLLDDANKSGTIILLALFSRESWNENIRLSDGASDKAVQALTVALKPYRNLIFQVWNEHDYRTVDYLKIIKETDQNRLVTNSPGYGGVLGSPAENWALDFLSPHTSRDDHRHWQLAEEEIRYLISKYQKPVVDDEPARRGTPQFGGPRSPTFPADQIVHIFNVWKAGGFAVYHHDMFQTGYGTDAIPPNGIPLPGFSPYHDQVFELFKNKDRYLRLIRGKE
ncbi:MAG: cellulase family glycosylhydrolase [Mariniphaga sp.]|nr:cellulase family glycosylhydrolase [Mariniphaga sp.]